MKYQISRQHNRGNEATYDAVIYSILNIKKICQTDTEDNFQPTQNKCRYGMNPPSKMHLTLTLVDLKPVLHSLC